LPLFVNTVSWTSIIVPKKFHKKEKRGKDYTTPYPKHITPLAERLAYARVPARLPPRRSPPASAAPFATTSTTPLGEAEATAAPPRH